MLQQLPCVESTRVPLAGRQHARPARTPRADLPLEGDCSSPISAQSAPPANPCRARRRGGGGRRSPPPRPPTRPTQPRFSGVSPARRRLQQPSSAQSAPHSRPRPGASCPIRSEWRYRGNVSEHHHPHWGTRQAARIIRRGATATAARHWGHCQLVGAPTRPTHARRDTPSPARHTQPGAPHPSRRAQAMGTNPSPTFPLARHAYPRAHGLSNSGQQRLCCFNFGTRHHDVRRGGGRGGGACPAGHVRRGRRNVGRHRRRLLRRAAPRRSSAGGWPIVRRM